MANFVAIPNRTAESDLNVYLFDNFCVEYDVVDNAGLSALVQIVPFGTKAQGNAHSDCLRIVRILFMTEAPHFRRPATWI